MLQTVCETMSADAEVETVLYFSTLATTMNAWRFSPCAIVVKWTHLRGPASSMLHASRQPPKCLSGRWSTADAERFLLERPWEDMLMALEMACSKEAAPKCTRASGALDVEGEVDATSNRENVTCWKMKSLSAIFHPVWQTIHYNVRDPLRHFCRFLVVVPRGSCKVGKLARLVCVKASGIANAFDVLIDADAWSEQVRVLPTSGSCCTLWLLLSSAANFDRRVLQMTRAFPMRLLWLARAQPSTLQRRRVADELINTSADFLRTPL